MSEAKSGSHYPSRLAEDGEHLRMTAVRACTKSRDRMQEKS
jgi:hypothetical protein